MKLFFHKTILVTALTSIFASASFAGEMQTESGVADKAISSESAQDLNLSDATADKDWPYAQ